MTRVWRNGGPQCENVRWVSDVSAMAFERVVCLNAVHAISGSNSSVSAVVCLDGF